MSKTAEKHIRKFSRRNRTKFFFGHLHAQDLLYAQMVETAVSKMKLDTPPFYPIGGAANYSLLYVLLRANTELPVGNVIELGIGQSTLLLDALGAAGVSVEHDEKWVEILQSKVSRRKIAHAPLTRASVHGRDTQVYSIEPGMKANLVLIDGPQGKPRFSRWGALKLLDEVLEDDFLVIVDDVDRRGEQDLALEIMKTRDNVKVHFVSGRSSQCLIFTPGFGAANWF